MMTSSSSISAEHTKRRQNRIQMIVVPLSLILKAFEGNGRSQIYRTHTAIDVGAWISVVNVFAKKLQKLHTSLDHS